MEFVQIEGLTKQFGHVIALSNVNLSIDHGDFLTVVGPSGSGKTTLLRLLDLLEEPSSGKISIGGEDTSNPNNTLRLRRGIGIVFQHNLMLNTSVYENVVYPLKIRSDKSDASSRVHKVLEQVGLAGYEKRRAITLSGGEMQRVALAQALIYKPKILLLDEPTANLDPHNSSIIESIVARVNREDNVTVVLSTHNIAQAERFATKVLILRSGEVADYGSASRIFENPSSFLASFTEKWNIFHGKASPSTKDELSIIDIGDGVSVESSTLKHGNVNTFINPDEIILTLYPVESSARNMLEGHIIQIVDLGERVQLDVDCGKKFTVRITKKSFKEMALNLEARVYLNFKASSVKIT